jgi:hypothetical protein
MAAPSPTNYAAAAARAGKNLLPYVVLFYLIDVVLWWPTQGAAGSAGGLVFNVLVSTLFLLGFFLIDFYRGIRAQRQSVLGQGGDRVVVVQQPVYMQPPPGYGYPPYAQPPPYPGYPPYGQAPYPPGSPGPATQGPYAYPPYPPPPSPPPGPPAAPPDPAPPAPAPPTPDPRRKPPEESA